MGHEEALAEMIRLRQRLHSLEIQGDFGLVWDELPEDVEQMLVSEVPVLAAVPSLDVKGARPSESPHVLIEGDNLHALYTLQATHRNAVDVIYIDPPYNTGNKDWMYNDQFVDGDDTFRHSKWLSFMAKRLVLAKDLLKDDGVLVISIGSDEVHRLALLSGQIFAERDVHLVTVQTSGGKPSGGFNYVHEYLVFVVPKDFSPTAMSFSGGRARSPWEGMTLATFNKIQRPNQVYPIFVNKKTRRLEGTGPSLAELVRSGVYKGDVKSYEYETDEIPQGCVAIWPITAKGEECVWRLIPSRLTKDYESGYISITPNVRKEHRNDFSIQYLPAGVIKKVKSGEITTTGNVADLPTLMLGENVTEGTDIPTIWSEQGHYTTKSTDLLKSILGAKGFQYPKPLQLMIDVLTSVSYDTSDFCVLDFFAGSGTTLHAVAQMNDEDGGSRRCILVTNDENGICRKVTQPRIAAILSGKWADKDHDALPGSLAFYKTDFITRRKNLDRMRSDVAKHTVDLVAIKEGAIRTKPMAGDLAVLVGEGKTIAVVTSLYPDHITLHEAATKLARENDKWHAYLFTWSDHGIEAETVKIWSDWQVQPLPAEMLAALRRLAPAQTLFVATEVASQI